MSAATAPRFFVIHKTREGREIVGEHVEESAAQEHRRSLVALGWPRTLSAAIYRADSRQQLQDELDGRVRLVCGEVGAGYWDSPEGREQAEKQREREEYDCQEEWI